MRSRSFGGFKSTPEEGGSSLYKRQIPPRPVMAIGGLLMRRKGGGGTSVIESWC